MKKFSTINKAKTLSIKENELAVEKKRRMWYIDLMKYDNEVLKLIKEYYKITCDSSCDLPSELCDSKDVAAYHMVCTLNGASFTDAMTEESCIAFYDAIRAGGDASTSQVGIGAFLEFWEPYAKDGTPVLHIALGSAISGTYANALTAAESLSETYPAWKYEIIDSLSASAGIGLMVLRAVELRDFGMELRECAKLVREMANNVNAVFTTSDLTALYKGGRISRVSAAFGTALNIIPIMHLTNTGALEVWQKVRGESKCESAMRAAVRDIATEPEKNTLIVSHADNLERAQHYGELMRKEFGFKEVIYTRIGPTIGTHTGPGLIALFFLGKDRKPSANK